MANIRLFVFYQKWKCLRFVFRPALFQNQYLRFRADSVRVEHVGGKPHAGGFEGGLDSSSQKKYGTRGKIPETWWVQARGNGLAVAARQRKQYVGYPTQKPIALLERIIKASSNEGEMVLDPFCGCATACVAAERLNRQWAGIDLSPKAAQLVKIRIEKDNPLLFTQHPMAHRTDIPNRTDLGKLPNYRTHKHTLFGKQEGECAGCQIVFPFRNFTIDHIAPRSKGGSDHLGNLQLLCGACNSVKGNRSQAFLVAELRRNGIL